MTEQIRTLGAYTWSQTQYPNYSYPGPHHVYFRRDDTVWAYGETGWQCVSHPERMDRYRQDARGIAPTPVNIGGDWSYREQEEMRQVLNNVEREWHRQQRAATVGGAL
jgi:hypothetical protein